MLVLFRNLYECDLSVLNKSHIYINLNALRKDLLWHYVALQKMRPLNAWSFNSDSMRVSYHRLYSWLSLSRILEISNFVLSRTILPVPWLFFSWSKQKTSGISNFYLSRINFAVSWAISSCYAKSCKFSSQISLFSTSASTMTTIVPARMSQDYQISRKSPPS